MTELGGRQLALKQFQPGIHALNSASLGTKCLTDRAVNRSLILAKETYQRTKFSFTNRKFGRIYRQGIIGRHGSTIGPNESMIPDSESGSHLSIASKASMKSTGDSQVFHLKFAF